MKIVSFASKVLLSVLYLVDYRQKAKENDIEGAKKCLFMAAMWLVIAMFHVVEEICRYKRVH